MAGHEEKSFFPENIIKITQAGENNDLLDGAKNILEDHGVLSEEVQARLDGLRERYQLSEDIDVTGNELSQLVYLLEEAINHNRVEERVNLIEMVLEDFIGHQQREFQRSENPLPETIVGYAQGLGELLQEHKIAKFIDAWVGEEPGFTFILIPQIHKDPRKSFFEETTAEIQEIQQMQIMPLLGILADNGICNIVANEGSKLLNGPISRVRIESGLDILASSDSGVFLAEFAFPELDSFGIEELNYNPDEFLNPSVSIHILRQALNDVYSTEEGSKQLVGLLEENSPISYNELFSILGIGARDSGQVEKFLVDRSVVNPSTFKDYLISIANLGSEDIIGEYNRVVLVERNQGIVENLFQVQKNTNTNCVSLVMGAGHFQDLSEIGGQSIQRILREKGISYVTLAPYSVDMEGYDFIEE